MLRTGSIVPAARKARDSRTQRGRPQAAGIVCHHLSTRCDQPRSLSKTLRT
ncbi:hypothetical protein C7S17_5837 [Burkholderia thailandensis]|nr:hypothetical protein [Burkholderia thailandensis]